MIMNKGDKNMRELIINIDTENDAFEKNGIGEVINCLEQVKQKIQNGYWFFAIMDSNGNRVGFCNLKEK